MLRVSSIAFVAVAAVWQSSTTLPQVTPIFTDGPERRAVTFLVSCQNGTSTAVQPGNGETVRVWIDGQPNRPSGIGHSGPMAPPVPPGAAWREVIALHPVVGSSGSVRGRVANQMDFTFPLTAGRHTVSFECGGARSADVPFYWNAVLD